MDTNKSLTFTDGSSRWSNVIVTLDDVKKKQKTKTKEHGTCDYVFMCRIV